MLQFLFTFILVFFALLTFFSKSLIFPIQYNSSKNLEKGIVIYSPLGA